MKKKSDKNKGVVKGAPSGFVISILIHVAAFLLAGLLVVFNAVIKEEKQFVPPKPVERPKIKLKKPKVKIKKSSKPKPTTRIVTKMNKASMPDIQLPEMTGLGDGLGDIGDGFDIGLDFSEDTIVGSTVSMGTDFEGTLYDFKRTRRGTLAIMDGTQMLLLVKDFLVDDWNENVFARYYRSPKKLFATTIFLPSITSHKGPTAYGESDMGAYWYLLHYKGKIVHPKGGRFRFHFVGDNLMFIRLNGKLFGDFARMAEMSAGFEKTSFVTPYHMGHWPAYRTKWFDLEPGVPLDMEVLFGETDGGSFSAAIAVEQEGVTYPSNIDNAPMFPIFKTAKLSRDQQELIYKYLYKGNYYAITNGPVFNDFEDDHDDYETDYRDLYR